jgi:hypothetical protein
MEYTSAQKKILSEADADLRRAERTGEPGQHTAWKLRTGQLNQDQVRALAMLDDQDARAYLAGMGEEVPNLRIPREMGEYFVNEERIGALRQAAIRLCGQALTKVRGIYKRTSTKYDDQHQQTLEQGLRLFQNVLTHARNLESGAAIGLGQIDAELPQDLHGAYNEMSNWADYWGNPVRSSWGWTGDYPQNAFGDVGTVGYEDPRNRSIVQFKGLESPGWSAGEVDPLYMAMASLAEALRSLDDLFDPYESIAGGTDATLRRAFGSTMKGLIPILGLEMIKSGLSKALA